MTFCQSMLHFRLAKIGALPLLLYTPLVQREAVYQGAHLGHYLLLYVHPSSSVKKSKILLLLFLFCYSIVVKNTYMASYATCFLQTILHLYWGGWLCREPPTSAPGEPCPGLLTEVKPASFFTSVRKLCILLQHCEIIIANVSAKSLRKIDLDPTYFYGLFRQI